MLKKIVGLFILMIALMNATCLAANTTKIPFSDNFDLKTFIQKFNLRNMENDELTIIDMKQVGLNTGQTRYKCLLSDNYALLNFDMRGNRLEGISVVAMGREGKYQKAIETLYSAIEFLGVPGTRDEFWDVAHKQYRTRPSTNKSFAYKKMGNGYDVWTLEAYPNQNKDVFVGISRYFHIPD